MHVIQQNGELFTGPGVRNLVGANKDYDGTNEIKPPEDLSTEWDCIYSFKGELMEGS